MRLATVTMCPLRLQSTKIVILQTHTNLARGRSGHFPVCSLKFPVLKNTINKFVRLNFS